MNKLELTSLNCTNCGASLSNYEGKNEIQCEYCDTYIKVLRPRVVKVSQGTLSVDNYDKLNNYVEILQKAIRAGNFNEGYEYCNKALEINPNIGSIWENKAICAFWRSVSLLNEDRITISNAREIRTFLNASKENDPNSDTYEITADAIGSNLFTILMIKFESIFPDTTTVINKKTIPSYSLGVVNRAKDYLETIETAYDIMVNKDIEILDYLVLEFSNHGKMIWWEAKNPYGPAEHPTNTKPTELAIRTRIDVEKKRDSLIKRILAIDKTYETPKIKISVTPIWIFLFAIVLGLFFLLFTLKGI